MQTNERARLDLETSLYFGSALGEIVSVIARGTVISV